MEVPLGGVTCDGEGSRWTLRRGGPLPTINYYLKTICSDSELEEDAVIRNFRMTTADGKSYDSNRFLAGATSCKRRKP